MSGRRRDDSLQRLLRARREPRQLLSPEEVRRREAEREREAARADAAAEAARLAAAWRETRKAPASADRAVLAALFELDPDAYRATARWARLAAAQRALAPACEVERCRATGRLHAHHVTHRNVGAEEPGRDLVTLCTGCRRRAAARSRARGRPLTRAEIRALDPEAPLFDRASITALRERYAAPPRPPAT